MRENCTSGLMSGEGKRSAHKVAAAPLLDSTKGTEERLQRCRSHRGGRDAAQSANRTREDARSTRPASLPSGSLSLGLAADCYDQSDPSLPYRARHRGQDWIEGFTQLYPRNFGEPARRYLTAHERSDRWPL